MAAETNNPHIISTGPAEGMLPVEGRSPITVIGTSAIRAGFDARCLQQAITSRMAPGVTELVLNPDGHADYGAPVGCVMVSPDHIYPGHQPAHLTAVNAAAAICSATVHGASIGSRELKFSPGAVKPGEYTFAVGSAGSTTLVLQMVLPALLTASGPSSLTWEGGGTHRSRRRGVAIKPLAFTARGKRPAERGGQFVDNVD